MAYRIRDAIGHCVRCKWRTLFLTRARVLCRPCEGWRKRRANKPRTPYRPADGTPLFAPDREAFDAGL